MGVAFVGSNMHVLNLVAHLNHVYVSRWCVVRCGPKNGYVKDWCLKEIALHVTTMIIVLFSLFSMTPLGNAKNVMLLRCRLLVNMTNGLKLSYYRGNTKT